MNKFLSICISSLLCFSVNGMFQNQSFDAHLVSPTAIKKVYMDDEYFNQYYEMSDIDKIRDLEDNGLQLLSENPILIWSDYYYNDVVNMLNSVYVHDKSIEDVLLNLFHCTSISNGIFHATAPINKVAKRIQKRKNRKRFSKIITVIDNVLELAQFKSTDDEYDSNITITISKEDIQNGYTLQFDV